MALTKSQEENAKRNRKYWADREDEALKHYIQDEKEYDKQIERIYQSQLDAIQKEIDAFYGKYANKEGITLAEAKKRVSKLDIAAYERKAKRYVKDKDFSAKANEEMRLYNATMKINRLEMLKANIGLELIKGHDELEKFMGGILKGRTEEELKRQAGILGKTITNNAQLAHTIPNASFHNATFSDRIWLYQDLMRADLSKLLQTGLIQGKNPRVLAKELEKYVMGKNGAKYNAERLMRTELARVQTEAQKQSFERNGFEQYTFIANSNCCDVCQALDGKHFKVADMMPGENASPMHPHCKCSTAAYSDRKEYDEWLDYLASGGTTEEYNKLKAQGVTPTKATKPEQKKDSFTPAKTIEEAEAFAKQFVDGNSFGAVGVSYKGVSVDVANAINKTLNNFYQKYNVGKFGGVVAPAGNTKLGKLITNATAGYSPIRNSFILNRKSLKDIKNAQAHFDKEISVTKDVLTHPEKYDFNKVSKRVRDVFERAKVSGRTTVPANIEEAINHELGHALERQVYKSDRWKDAEANMPKYADKISGYAGESKSEYIAESFASYLKGESVADPVLVEIFESLER